MAEKNLFGGSEREYSHPTVEEKSGLGSLFERFFGGNAGAASGSMDPNAGKTYYPPTNVNQVGTYVDTFPEAKQVVGPGQYGGQQPTPFKAARGPYVLRGGLGLTRTIQDEMSQYGGSPTRRNWYDEIRSLYEPGGYYGPGSNYEEYGPLQFQQSLLQGYGDTIEDDSEMQYFPELEDYYASGEFDYPNPDSVFDTRNYPQLPLNQIPGYELGQGLGMDDRMYEGILGKYLDEFDPREGDMANLDNWELIHLMSNGYTLEEAKEILDTQLG